MCILTVAGKQNSGELQPCNMYIPHVLLLELIQQISLVFFFLINNNSDSHVCVFYHYVKSPNIFTNCICTGLNEDTRKTILYGFFQKEGWWGVVSKLKRYMAFFYIHDWNFFKGGRALTPSPHVLRNFLA